MRIIFSSILVTGAMFFSSAPAVAFKTDRKEDRSQNRLVRATSAEVSVRTQRRLQSQPTISSIPIHPPTTPPASTGPTLTVPTTTAPALTFPTSSTTAPPTIPASSTTASTMSTLTTQGSGLPPDPELNYSFQVKMFWEKGMRWQERKIRKQYCVECATGCEEDKCKSGSCKDGRSIMINECDASERTQYWLYDEGRLKPQSAPSLCWTRQDKYVELDQCSSSKDERQVFTPFNEFEQFQIRPRGHYDWDRKRARCLTNQHHPKSNEPLYMDDCKTAEDNDAGKYDDTSRWVIGIGWNGHSGKSNWGPDEGGYYPAGGITSAQGGIPPLDGLPGGPIKRRKQRRHQN